MKKYLLDKLLELTIHIWIFSYILIQAIKGLSELSVYGLVVLCIIDFIEAFCAIVLCKPVLCFPLDLICGKKQKTCYFSKEYQTPKYEFIRNGICFRMKFYEGNRVFCLLYPVSTLESDSALCDMPPKNTPIVITYYKYSKLLCSWDVISACSKT